jgi:hypothetical protein
MRKNLLLAVLLLLALSGINTFAQKAVVASGVPNETNSAVKGVPQTYPPGIMFSTLMENVSVNARGGFLKLGNQMQNVFMPDGSTGKAVLSRADGTEFCHWKWKLDGFGLKPPYKLFGFAQPLNADGSRFNYQNLKLTKPGAYTFDFFLGDKRFYTFPFSVRTLEPDNPFDGKTRYLTDGPWNDWGYLYYSNADPEQNLIWKIWMREELFSNPSHKVMVKVVRDKGGKVICQSRPNTSKRFRNDWVRHSFDMVNPPVKTSGGAYFKTKDLLAVDGGYTLTMEIDGKLYGVWKFKVAGGKFNYTGRTVRGTADPLTFVEGGKDAFWYKRESK